MSEATPRITAPYLEAFSHRTVRILGKVAQIRGETGTLDSSGQITCHLNRVSGTAERLGIEGEVELIVMAPGCPLAAQSRLRNYRQSAE